MKKFDYCDCGFFCRLGLGVSMPRLLPRPPTGNLMMSRLWMSCLNDPNSVAQVIKAFFILRRGLFRVAQGKDSGASGYAPRCREQNRKMTMDGKLSCSWTSAATPDDGDTEAWISPGPMGKRRRSRFQEI